MQGRTIQEADRQQAVLSYHLGVQQLHIGSYPEAMQRFHAASDALGDSHLLWLRLAECAVELSGGTSAVCSEQRESNCHSRSRNERENCHPVSQSAREPQRPSRSDSSTSKSERVDGSQTPVGQTSDSDTPIVQRSDGVENGGKLAVMCAPLERAALLMSAVHSLEHASPMLSDKLQACQSADLDQREQLQEDLLQVLSCTPWFAHFAVSAFDTISGTSRPDSNVELLPAAKSFCFFKAFSRPWPDI